MGLPQVILTTSFSATAASAMSLAPTHEQQYKRNNDDQDYNCKDPMQPPLLLLNGRVPLLIHVRPRIPADIVDALWGLVQFPGLVIAHQSERLVSSSSSCVVALLGLVAHVDVVWRTTVERPRRVITFIIPRTDIPIPQHGHTPTIDTTLHRVLASTDTVQYRGRVIRDQDGRGSIISVMPLQGQYQNLLMSRIRDWDREREAGSVGEEELRRGRV